MHNPDNLNGTYSNPVMPNGHWSDPNAIRVGDDYYAMSSSIESCPVMQILHSNDLVNWTVAGSVFRQWPEDLPPAMNWSPRFAVVGQKYRVYFNHTGPGFSVVESDTPTGPWERLEHRLEGFDDLSFCGFGATVFTDMDDTIYLVWGNQIRQLTPDGLEFDGEAVTVAEGFLENPWLIHKDGWYYYFNSENGTTVWGLTPDRAKISAWRSKTVLGPYEASPHPFIGNNLRFQCANTGNPVEGPDGEWYYLYNAFDVQRLTLCRQMMLDRIEWTDDEWPVVNNGKGPSETAPSPVVESASSAWTPDLNDEFDSDKLEGVTDGVLGSKWLFRREDPEAWSLTENPGSLRLHTRFPGLENHAVANFICQRPASAYYSVETRLHFHAGWSDQTAGLAIRELQSQATCAVGLQQEHVRYLCVWVHPGSAHVQGTGGLLGGNGGLQMTAKIPFYEDNGRYTPRTSVDLKILLEGPVFRCFYRDPSEEEWTSIGGDFSLGWSNHNMWFTAFHPGLFAANHRPNQRPGQADFDYFRWTDLET